MHKIFKIEYMYQAKYATEIINNRVDINDTDENVHVKRWGKKNLKTPYNLEFFKAFQKNILFLHQAQKYLFLL